MVMPTEASLKDFKNKIKENTVKSWTLNSKAWIEKLNPIIRGKVNYYLNLHKAIDANKKYGQQSRCFVKAIGKQLHMIDAYTRQRLRVAMIHKNPNQRKGHLMKQRWNNEYFVKIGLVPSNWWFFHKMWGYEIEKYIDNLTNKIKKRTAKKIGKMKERGQEYYTPARLNAIAATKMYI